MPPIQTRSALSASRRQYRTTRDLTAEQRSLVQIMCEYQFGRVENVSVHAGQPLLDQNMKIVRVARLGGESGGTCIPITDEFELKQAVRDLFDELDRLRDCLIVRLEFKRGLPCLLETAIAVPPREPPNAPARPESPAQRGAESQLGGSRA